MDDNFPEYNLCNVLNATNETIGMGIYLEMARIMYYKSIPELKSNTDDSQVMWVCFEEMKNDPVGTENRIRDRFLPNLTSTQNSPSRRLGSGHSTNPDPVLRKRLHAIARELDCKYFGCTTKLWNDALGCKSSIQADNATTAQEIVSSNAKPDSNNNHTTIQPGVSNEESSSNKLEDNSTEIVGIPVRSNDQPDNSKNTNVALPSDSSTEEGTSSNKRKGKNTENDLYGGITPSLLFQRLIVVGLFIGICIVKKAMRKKCTKMIMRPLRMSRHFRETAV